MIFTLKEQDELNTLMAEGRIDEARRLQKRIFHKNKTKALGDVKNWNSTIKINGKEANLWNADTLGE